MLMPGTYLAQFLAPSKRSMNVIIVDHPDYRVNRTVVKTHVQHCHETRTGQFWRQYMLVC